MAKTLLTFDIYYIWRNIEGIVVKGLKNIVDSFGEDLPCYACNSHKYPGIFCADSNQYKPHSGTKCKKGFLYMVKKLATLQDCLV